MTTQARAQVKSEQGCAKRQGIEGRDVAGILMGAPILLVGLFLLAINGGNLARGLSGALDPVWILYFIWGVVLLLVSIGLFIPGQLYEWWHTCAVGFTAAVLATAVAVPFAILATLFAWAISDPNDEWALLGASFGAAGLAGFAYAVGCTSVLLKKLELETKEALATIAVGIGVGALNILLMYLLHVSPFFD